MSERGRSEPIRAQAREQAPIAPSRLPQLPPLKPEPVKREPRKKHPIRRALIGLGTAGVLTTVGAVGYNAVKGESPETGPGPTGPRVTGIEPTGPTSNPTIEPSVSPETPKPPQENTLPKVKDLPPSEDLLWQLKPAPLGILTEKDWGTSNAIFISARFVDTFKDDVNFQGEKTKGWFATFIVGENAQGESVTADFFLGRAEKKYNDITNANLMRSQSIDVDPKPDGTSSSIPITPTPEELVSQLESEADSQGLYKPYALLIYDKYTTFSADCDERPFCVFFKEAIDKYGKNNTEIKNAIYRSKENTRTNLTPTPNETGFLSLLYITPDHPET